MRKIRTIWDIFTLILGGSIFKKLFRWGTTTFSVLLLGWCDTAYYGTDTSCSEKGKIKGDKCRLGKTKKTKKKNNLRKHRFDHDLEGWIEFRQSQRKQTEVCLPTTLLSFALNTAGAK